MLCPFWAVSKHLHAGICAQATGEHDIPLQRRSTRWMKKQNYVFDFASISTDRQRRPPLSAALTFAHLFILHLKLKEEPVLFKSERCVDAQFSSSCVLISLLRPTFQLMSHLLQLGKEAFLKSVIIFNFHQSYVRTPSFPGIVSGSKLPSAPLSSDRTLTGSFSRIYWKSLRNWVHNHITRERRVWGTACLAQFMIFFFYPQCIKNTII